MKFEFFYYLQVILEE